MDIEDNKYGKTDTMVDSIVFYVFAAVLACRLFIMESIPTSGALLGGGASGGIVGHGGPGFMLSFDIVLLLGSALWLAVKIKMGNICWRRTNMVLPGLLLLAAGVVSYCSSSDKGAALVGVFNLVSIFAAGLVMVQLLAEPVRRKILLAVILSLGVCQVWRCYEQQAEHEATIKQMEQDYNGFMTQQGLEPESWQARQMEERVRSRDTGGYFSISNTGASYLILTLTGAVCVAAAGRWRKKDGAAGGVIGIALIAVMMFGVVLTDSTGGKLSLVAMAAAIAGMAVLGGVGKRKLFFAVFVCMLVVGAAAVAGYGLKNDRLPTSNLWIRWQYWLATAGMIADHWLAGVGANNFGHYYSYYMDPMSPEVVKDPHCVPLAIFSQWGILGIAAMVWAALAVVWLLVKPGRDSESMQEDKAERYQPVRLILSAVFMTLVIFVVRQISVDESGGEIPDIARGYLTLMPAATFGVLYLVFSYLFVCREEINLAVRGRLVLIVLLAGLAAFALHNTIDFAFFQPGVGMMFFFAASLAIAAKETEVVELKNKQLCMYGAAVGVVVVIAIAILPALGGGVYRSEKAVKHAEKCVAIASESRQLGYVDKAISVCLDNAEASPNDVRSLFYAARLSNQMWHISDYKESRFFDIAVSALERLKLRDAAHFKYDKMLGEIYVDMARRYTKGSERQTANLDKAEVYFESYMAKVPGNSDVLAMLAEIKLEKGDGKSAKELAARALEIERGCMEMQPKLFPHRDVYYPRMDQQLQKRAEEIAGSE